MTTLNLKPTHAIIKSYYSMGKILEFTTFEAIDGRKTHEGVLVGMDKDNVVIERQGISTVIPRREMALARLKIDF